MKSYRVTLKDHEFTRSFQIESQDVKTAQEWGKIQFKKLYRTGNIDVQEVVQEAPKPMVHEKKKKNGNNRTNQTSKKMA